MPAEVIAALDASLDDERKAEATYIAVIDKLDPVAPFSAILEAERQHAAKVIALYQARNLAVPANSWVGRGTAADTLIDNCKIGVAAEEENIAMYDRLLASLPSGNDDVVQVFLALQAASRDNHLPAFRQCAGL
ncbi:MAG: DUF2202 domain-containing protein [Sphingomonadales bacterium]|nr:DUF2202 domain-containing protein [Sphingomonadales bacterium]MBD3775025.1 DUF2202 domain-containing protein [Paracoccaceae bacterium]